MRRIIKTLIATIALVLSMGGASAVADSNAPSSTPPANCQSSFNPYDYTAEALEACGIPAYRATVTTLPSGGQRYSYYQPDGILYAETTMPPEGFDPRTASDRELAEYGYPPRPIAPLAPQQEEWERMVSIPRTTPEPFMVKVDSFSASLESSDWSGRITDKGGFTYAESDYTEPSFDNSVCGESAEVTWAGIGGGPNASKGSYLFQTGTAHSNNLDIGFANHQPWWEIASGEGGSKAQPFASKAVASAGDTLVAITDTQSDPGKVSFSVIDYTSSQTWQTTVALKGRTASPATAEMIAERPKVNESYPALSKFGSLVLDSNKAAQEGFALYLNEFPNEGIFMINGASELANPTSLGAQGLFEVAWQHCQ
jgi:hypothetical protein